MRLLVAAALCLGLSASGCTRAEPTLRVAAETREEAAARVFAKAESLAKEQKTKEAFAAYRQIALQFPHTPHGKQAATRLQQVQRDAARKAVGRKPTGKVRPGSG
jgi:outer membrane protein assembly factor BamD (BamD/ComL family)